ncbi:hypothetical protein RhiJN_20672 [Ceratobasidium sp. AG-Ba]|nr:hypothetical protein RhiJN_20672 [Ceratobasidium sp. AG-Ba]
MGRSTPASMPHDAVPSQPAHLEEHNAQATAASENVEVDGVAGEGAGFRRGGYWVTGRRHTVIIAPPLRPPDFLARKQCRLDFVSRWLLFLFVLTSLLWPAIQEPRRGLTGGIDVVSLTCELVPAMGTIKEAAIAVHEATAAYNPEEYVASRLLETLVEGINGALD